VPDILSQEEIDALLAALETGEVKIEEETKKQDVKIYDFRRPDKLSKDQLRTIQMIFENFTRSAVTGLSGYLRTAIEINLVSVDQVTYQEYIRSLTEPTFMVIEDVSESANIILEMSLPLVFIIIDKLLGGPGKPISNLRGLTTLEEKLMQRIVDIINSSLSEAWQPVANWNFQAVRLEYSPSFVQLVPPSDITAVTTMEVKMQEMTGIMTVAIPYVVLEPYVQKLSAQMWFTSIRKIKRDKKKVLNTIKDVMFDVAAVIGETDIPINDLLLLEVGDVIILDRKVNEPIDVEVEGHKLYKAIPGTVGRTRAVKVVSYREDKSIEESMRELGLDINTLDILAEESEETKDTGEEEKEGGKE